MRFDPENIKRLTEEDFEQAWMSGKSILPPPSLNNRYPFSSMSIGKEHPVFKMISRLRDTYLRLGFTEVVNPIIVKDSDVYKLFNKESLAVLDRCYYLAGLPRPNLGISAGKIQLVQETIGREITQEEEAGLKETFQGYKKGNIGGDDLLGELASMLSVSDVTILNVLDTAFPEFRDLKPSASSDILRSHMTSGWFLTLKEYVERYPPPIKLFSIDRCFRREQEEDATRLRSYFSASCVVAYEDVGLEDGKAVSQALFSHMGFDNIRFSKDKKRSKYYIPDTQTEVFGIHPNLKSEIEIATFGVYSPTALAQYDIPYSAVNLGVGVERLAMVLSGTKDIRDLTYPQLFTEWHLTDLELVRMLRLKKRPLTIEGEEIARKVVETCLTYRDTPSPCEFVAYQGTPIRKEVVVKIIEPEEETKLCGPALLNEFVVNQGNILGLLREDRWKKIFQEGVPANLSYLEGFANLVAYQAEQTSLDGNPRSEKPRGVRSLSDVNLELDRIGSRYITTYKKKIDVRGPLFLTAEIKCS